MRRGFAADERARREQRAYDEEGVWERSHAWNARVRHVLEGPNTEHYERVFESLLAEIAVRGGRVLEAGCAAGRECVRVRDLGASYVLGLDMSAAMIEEAKRHEEPGRLEFRVGDVQQPLDERFDLIFGRSVLHHIDFREVLDRAYRENLEPAGRMVFMEPMSHPLTLAFHRVVRSAHTPDERPLRPSDVTWFESTFGRAFRLHAVNLLSFPAGIVSTFAARSADNALMRAADGVDQRLARRRKLLPFFRQGIFVVDKPRSSG
jgi:2-polyprenyl-3-methyl-5-hydroxy-6-metoxy-1,4-benzoquinol methylase